MFANIFRRETIEASYPRDVFETDAGLNSTADAVILHGVFIGSAPDEQGQFRMARATRQVGKLRTNPVRFSCLHLWARRMAPFHSRAVQRVP
jgi:hypothetical protein